MMINELSSVQLSKKMMSMKSNSKIIILGLVPPPLGGVSVHVKRLLNELNLLDYDYEFYDLREGCTRNIIKYIHKVIVCLFHSKRKTIHYQLNNWVEVSLLVLWKRLIKFKIIYTVHSFRENKKEMTFLKRHCFEYAKNKIDLYIAPSKKVKIALEENGIRTDRIIILNTYVSPTKEELKGNVPHDLELEFCDERKIILCSASKLYKRNGVDVYGLDMCIKAAQKIFDKAKFIFCVPVIEDECYLDYCEKLIEEKGMKGSVCIYVGNVSLVPLYSKCDLFVRPTCTDSFGISVAEALDAGVPAVASDVCERADGCIIFKNRNIDDFVEKINIALKSDKTFHAGISCTREIIKIYDLLREGNEYGN